MKVLLSFLIGLVLFPLSTICATKATESEAEILRIIEGLKTEVTALSGKVNEQQQQVDTLNKEIDALKFVTVVCSCYRTDGTVTTQAGQESYIVREVDFMRGKGKTEDEAYKQASGWCKTKWNFINFVVGTCKNENTGQKVVPSS